MKMNSRLFFVLSAASLSFACAPAGDESQGGEGEDEAIAEVSDAVTVNNAAGMNGTVVNGSFINGIRHNGIRHNGIRHNGIRHNGMGLEGTAEDTGLTVSGTGYTGADIEGELGDTSVATVHVQSVSGSDVPGMYTYEITKDA